MCLQDEEDDHGHVHDEHCGHHVHDEHCTHDHNGTRCNIRVYDMI